TCRLGFLPLPPPQGPGGAVRWTAESPVNATAKDLAAALGGTVANPVISTNVPDDPNTPQNEANPNRWDVVVNTEGLPAGTWDVRFIRAFEGRNQNQLVVGATTAG